MTTGPLPAPRVDPGARADPGTRLEPGMALGAFRGGIGDHLHCIGFYYGPSDLSAQ